MNINDIISIIFNIENEMNKQIEILKILNTFKFKIIETGDIRENFDFTRLLLQIDIHENAYDLLRLKISNLKEYLTLDDNIELYADSSSTKTKKLLQEYNSKKVDIGSNKYHKSYSINDVVSAKNYAEEIFSRGVAKTILDKE